MPAIVTIDGPAGSGKSTAARLLDGRLGFDFLDTGAMYRAVALSCVAEGTCLNDADAIAGTALGRSISLEGERVLLDGRDVTAEIRSSEVTEAASVVAVVPEVRELLVSSQRGWASGRNVVTEGRDQGTIVFPDAMCKFFLTADPAERAARRQRELQEVGQPVSLDEMLGLIHERDERDATRETGPLVAAEDAAVIDTTGLTMEEVVELLEDRVRQRMAQQQQQQ